MGASRCLRRVDRPDPRLGESEAIGAAPLPVPPADAHEVDPLVPERADEALREMRAP